jgi:hypothetical protein
MKRREFITLLGGANFCEHKISAPPPKPDIRALMSTRPSTTLADFERHGIPKSVFL